MTRDLVQHSDTVDVADVMRTLKRQWRAVIAFTLLGMLAAATFISLAPRRYDGKASVMARAGGGGGASILGRMAEGTGDLLGGLGGMGGSPLETELQTLRSRALAGQVVDSLMLQFRTREPAGTPPAAFVASHSLAPAFEPRRYKFSKQANGTYTVAGDSTPHSATPGQPVSLAIGSLTLQASGLPDDFTLQILDREDAIARVARRMKINKAGGEVVRVEYRGDDPITAAAAPNTLIRFYTERRRTVDRGSNQRRVEYVETQVDSTAAELARAEKEMRRLQEATNVFDPEVSGETDVASAARLREQLSNAQVDEGTARQLLTQVDRGAMAPRELAAYPSFGSLSGMATQVSEIEIQRTRLLERRTERDPEVMAMDSSIKRLNANMVGMARSYASAATNRRAGLQAQVDSAQRALLALPAAGEKVGRLKRDIVRLTELYTALQAQLIDARLGAIGEGGDVRQLDVAAVPRGPAFPNAPLTMGLGTFGGLLAGLVAALLLGWFGRWLRDPIDVERALGVNALRFNNNAPLLVAGAAAQRTLLVIPLDSRAQSRLVAEGLARTATSRSLPATVLDLSASTNGNGSAGSAGSALAIPEHNVSRQIEKLEREADTAAGGVGLLVVQLPPLTAETTLAALRETRPVLLVASPGPVDRARVSVAVDTLRRLDVPIVGIVMSDANGGRRWSDRVRGTPPVT